MIFNLTHLTQCDSFEHAPSEAANLATASDGLKAKKGIGNSSPENTLLASLSGKRLGTFAQFVL